MPEQGKSRVETFLAARWRGAAFGAVFGAWTRSADFGEFWLLALFIPCVLLSVVLLGSLTSNGYTFGEAYRAVSTSSLGFAMVAFGVGMYLVAWAQK